MQNYQSKYLPFILAMQIQANTSAFYSSNVKQQANHLPFILAMQIQANHLPFILAMQILKANP